MMTFDINLALENVVQLKENIQRFCHIPVDKQVLLISGGDSLDPSARVCSYSAGTDTNPIFLFSKSTIESTTPPSPSIDYGSDTSDTELMKDRVDATLLMPATINTVAIRVQLAQQFHELAQDQKRTCTKIVHEQHLQQQGWAAVIANLDDTSTAFSIRRDQFEQDFQKYLESRDEYWLLLESFNADLETLAKVPLLPQLLENEGEESINEIGDQPNTLLEWIAAKDPHSSLQQVADNCRRGLEQLDEKFLETTKAEVEAALQAASNNRFREIDGLEDRLYGLEQLMNDMRVIVQEQGDLAQAFLQNQNRASDLKDNSILPDLCTSHKRQLQVMLNNHHQLRDIRRRCIAAKEELSINLYHRLKWVMFVENKFGGLFGKLSLYQDSLKRLRDHLRVLQQLHVSPHTYLRAVAEVVRRRTFSEAFLVWAGDIACQLYAVHSEELMRRKAFQEEFEDHFLTALFPGLEDVPPPFATQAPAAFDEKLPRLSFGDIEQLCSQLPDLALSLSVPDMSQITQLFLVKSIAGTLKTEPKDTSASIEDRLVEVVTAAGLASNLDPTLLQPADSQTSGGPSYNTQLTSDRGFESETDTEEFEKVGQSPTELAFDRPHHQRPENEVTVLRDVIRRLGGSTSTGLASLRIDFDQLKEWILSERSQFCAIIHDLNTNYSRCMEEKNMQIERLSESCRKNEEELSRLHNVAMDLENRLKRVLESEERERRQREELEETLQIAQLNREQIIKEVTEQLTHAHKKEMEAVRSRFKLMTCTSLERSPSDTSLERIEMSVHEAMRRVANEKEHQLESLRFQLMTMEAECQKYKETINKLTDGSGSGGSECCSLLDRVEALERAKEKLERELIEARQQTSLTHKDMSTSVALVDTDSRNRDAATSPDPVKKPYIREKLTKSTTSLINQGKLSIGSCNIGDTVLVVWDDTFSNYKIAQDSTTLYFLHSECLDTLGLRISRDASLRQPYVIGEVTEKEYCRTKTAENRYHVPQDTKFYRVRVKPSYVMIRSQHSQSQPQSTTSSMSSN